MHCDSVTTGMDAVDHLVAYPSAYWAHYANVWQTKLYWAVVVHGSRVDGLHGAPESVKVYIKRHLCQDHKGAANYALHLPSVRKVYLRWRGQVLVKAWRDARREDAPVVSLELVKKYGRGWTYTSAEGQEEAAVRLGTSMTALTMGRMFGPESKKEKAHE